ncbi:sensor histidine kinase [Thermodesulfatator atlanticus]|uniref:sensor histidine kinase n=1 Tax=Thermodesulfatator atlanticus TaxID=501497 RepID=UPI0003B52735|nr:HAMP domain-containing sensor histidine kinase [Thermodesulfatator atlanticus]
MKDVISKFLPDFPEHLFLLSPELEVWWGNNSFHKLSRENKKFCYELIHQSKEPPPGCPALKAFETQRTSWGIMPAKALKQDVFVIVSPIVKDEKVVALWHLAFETKPVVIPEETVFHYETFGQLAAGISHDIKNMLTAALAELELIGMLLKDKPNLEKKCAKIRTILENIASITKKLSDLGKKKTEPEILNLNQVLHELRPLLNALIPSNIEFRIFLDPYVKNVCISRIKLEQIILNLFLNAIQAIEIQGKITIRTEHRDDFSILIVEDTGKGLKQELIPKIFESYFTTKQKNSGLGLTLVKNWAEAAGGKVKVISTEGKGTCFEIWLPCI